MTEAIELASNCWFHKKKYVVLQCFTMFNLNFPPRIFEKFDKLYVLAEGQVNNNNQIITKIYPSNIQPNCMKQIVLFLNGGRRYTVSVL